MFTVQYRVAATLIGRKPKLLNSHKELRSNVVRLLYGLSIEIDYTWNCHTLHEPLDFKYVNQKLVLYHHATVRPRGAATGQVVEHGRLVGCGPRCRNV